MITKAKFTITGMHCTSCAMNIDGELEDTKGVKEASTNYAKGVSEVSFDEDILSQEELISIIKNVGYTAEVIEE